MKNLAKPNKDESDAVDARQELDLKMGVAFTRFQTKYFQDKFSGFDSRCVSYGPCQTPTLGFCVKRHLEIIRFVPESFWRLKLNLPSGVDMSATKKQKERKDDDDDDDDDGDEIASVRNIRVEMASRTRFRRTERDIFRSVVFGIS